MGRDIAAVTRAPVVRLTSDVSLPTYAGESIVTGVMSNPSLFTPSPPTDTGLA